MEMVRHTRLDCALGSAASMRKAVAEATHHAAHRSVFGRLLIDQPLMRNVLAELCLESEAATAFSVRLARAFDRSHEDAHEQKFLRVATAIAKYFITKRAPEVVGEALECLGGNGYVFSSKQTPDEFGARRFVERIALALEGAVLLRAGNQPIADLFCAARLASSAGLALGTLPPTGHSTVQLLLDRARPKLPA